MASCNKSVIGICVGEISGDNIAAELIIAIKKANPNVEFIGITGPKMRAAGCKSLYSLDNIAVMGFSAVIFRLYSILSIRQKIIKYFSNYKPNIFIGVDAPDFNLTVEKKLKRLGIKTIHYVSPTIWAWRAWRIKKIKKAVAQMLCIFPFETKIYNNHNIACKFVGHHLADKKPLIATQSELSVRFNIPAERFIIAILPGSRSIELKLLAKIFLQAAAICLKQLPKLFFIVSAVSEKAENYLSELKITPEMQNNYMITRAPVSEIVTCSDYVMATSGTVTLEVMLLHKPMLVAYKTSMLNWLLAKLLVKTNYCSFPNILADTAIVAEFLQTAATAEKIASYLEKTLSDKSVQLKQIDKFKQLSNSLRGNASEEARNVVLEMLSA